MSRLKKIAAIFATSAIIAGTALTISNVNNMITVTEQYENGEIKLPEYSAKTGHNLDLAFLSTLLAIGGTAQAGILIKESIEEKNKKKHYRPTNLPIKQQSPQRVNNIPQLEKPKKHNLIIINPQLKKKKPIDR